MAKQVKKSGLAAKLGTRGNKAVATHKDDETVYSGGGELPPGIENGIAELVECKFGEYAKGDMKGQPFFMASAVVKVPTVHEGVPIEGLRTNIGPEPLCDTPQRSRKSLDDHMGWVLNELRKLGLDTSGLEVDDLEEAAETLKEQAPMIRFRTWKGEPTKEYPNPRTNHQWNGLFEGELPEAAEQIVDESGLTDATAEVEAASEEEPDLTALAEAADADDEEAQQTLQDLAVAAGINHEEYESWGELAEALAAPEEGEEDVRGFEAKDEEDWKPVKDEIYYYKPPKKPGQKTAPKKTEVEIMAVFESSKKVNMKDLSSGAIYKSIPWDDLLTE